MSARKIVFFASGSGSNMENIVQYFRKKGVEHSYSVFCNNATAFVLERAKNLGIEARVFDRRSLRETGEVLAKLKAIQPDLIVLAGFLLLMPADIVQTFPNRIINIHPALLPKHGGKGMYGGHVHQAVVEQRDKESGITIHYVNEHYDEGAYIFQTSCAISPKDTPEDVAGKVHALEYEHFPRIVEKVLSSYPTVDK